MSDKAIIFLIIVGFLMSWQVIYAILQGAPQCSFARDVITCIEIVKVNRWDTIMEERENDKITR